MPKFLFVTIAAQLLTLGLAMRVDAQQNYDPPAPFPPDAQTTTLIALKRAALLELIAVFPANTPRDVKADVEVYAKAAEWIARHNEFYVKDSGKQTLAVLDAGMARAKAAASGKAPWRDVRNKPVIRGYYSQVDGSVQPYSVTLPEGYGTKPMRLDVVIHGRDATLTEVKFIHAKEVAKPTAKGNEFVVLEPYGRGNNAYRWAGETDVYEARNAFIAGENKATPRIDEKRLVLRGFSMGGAGTWHLGLHHPFDWNVIGPGAGFTSTRGYIKNLPKTLPEHQEKGLHIYDAVDYAENVFNLPVVAYSGANDPQKAAADNIVNALENFREPYQLTHLVAPGLEHKMPPEWMARAETEYQKYADKPRQLPDTVRFTTYTTRFADFGYGTVTGLEEHYQRATVIVKKNQDTLEITTTNVRGLSFVPVPKTLRIDGTTITGDGIGRVRKSNGKWAKATDGVLEKTNRLQGPIDDAFQDSFVVSRPTKSDSVRLADTSIKSSLARFDREWDRYFRGQLPEFTPDQNGHLVLFGTPASNPMIAKILSKLPITWTANKLIVNGVEYDANTHYPVLIYPNPLNPTRYVVLNSGHTFHEADLKGTNALLYPRLGDWTVLKATPTDKDPAATEVIAAGIFDEFWQFKK